MSARHIVLIVIAAVVAIFVLQNTQVVEIQLLFWKITASRALILGVTFLLGMVSGFLIKMRKKKKPNCSLS